MHSFSLRGSSQCLQFLVLLWKARQRSDSGCVLYKKKFGLSSSRCFVLICLGKKICIGVLVIEIGKLSVFLSFADYLIIWTVMTGADEF